jgi:hypothetical protein
MWRVLLIATCAAAMSATPAAQAPDIDAIGRARVQQGQQLDEASVEELWRRLRAPARWRNFSEFRGTWVLDEAATAGIQYTTGGAAAPTPVDAFGVEIARRIVITSTDTEIVLTKDDGGPEAYGFDGMERHAAAGQASAPGYSFALVAGALALTSRTARCCDDDQRPWTEVLTDAYSLVEFDVLKVERQSSVLRGRAGSPAALSRVRRLPDAIIYRRVP